MYDNENTVWFSQTLLTFKDKQFSTDGYLKVAISTNTNDYKFFNPPIFNISISTNIQKSYNLNIQQAEDLFESFSQVLKQSNGNDIMIEKRYLKTSNIYFKFTMDNVNQMRVVVIEIISNEADSSKVIIPLKPTFQSLIRRLKYYVENYDQICFNLLNKTIDHSSTQIIQQLPSLIKGISSQITAQIPEQEFIPDSRALEISPDDVEKTSMSIADLDNFMGEDMKNIDIPELKEKKIEEKPTIIEIKSEFVEKVLDGDLMNLESKLVSYAAAKQPILDLANELEESLQFSLLGNISEDDKKSLVYLSTLFQNYFAKSYTINDTAIPSNTILLKFDGEKNEKNVEFAKDILTIIGYMRMVRQRLESKIQNAYDNKALIYLYLRYFMDAFCFSFLDDLNKNEIVSVVQNRYIYFDQIGFFDSYKRLLEENGCKPITKGEMIIFAESASAEACSKEPLVEKIHNELYELNEVKLPTKNQFSLEQIINEFIPVEVSYKMEFNFQDKELVANYKEKNNISDEILNFFTKDSKVKSGIKMERVTPLQKWVDKYKQDIPENYRDSFVKYIKELEFTKFDFTGTSFPLDEFDENIIKALYIWDTESDSNMKTNFTHFASLVENEQMTKESILITSSEIKSTNESDWDNIKIGE
jgi:hypothetical protein